ncbi:MAG: acyl-CoA dehydrogenase family protein [Acidimicrobiia bacterium]
MDAADRELLQATVVDALTAHAEANPVAEPMTGVPARADGVLADLGWFEMLEAEPRDAVGIVAHALGSTDTYASILDDVFAAALGVEPRADLAVVLPAYPGVAPPVAGDAGSANGTGIGTARAATASELLVVRGDDTAVLVPADAATVTPVAGIAPRWSATKIEIPTVVGADVALADGAWDRAIAAGRRAVGHELAGANRTMIALAREHALERMQFGKPIAQFQALRHKLAEALVALEATDAALVAAWDTADAAADSPEAAMTAALAKALAARGARTVAGHTQQVLAGIGFTTDHTFHSFLKRCLLLEGMLGTADSITLEVGRHLLATRTVPTLIELG